MNQSKSTSAHKGTILLILGGLLILGAAAYTLYKQNEKQENRRRETEETLAAERLKARKVFKPPQPLIVDEKTDPVKKANAERPKVEAENVQAAPKVSRTSGATSQRKSLNLGDPISNGTMDPKELSKFVNSKFASVRTCYERRLKVNPTLEGVVDLRIAVSPSGKVAGVSVNADSVGDRQMLECVKSTVRRWTFPKPEGGRIVFDKPFNFKKKV